jgi:ribosome-binding protein aMBF1 (putative translation factor)
MIASEKLEIIRKLAELDKDLYELRRKKSKSLKKESGMKIRMARVRKGISCTDLANLLGVSNGIITKLQEGRMRPNVHLKALNEILDIDLKPIESLKKKSLSLKYRDSRATWKDLQKEFNKIVEKEELHD